MCEAERAVFVAIKPSQGVVLTMTADGLGHCHHHDIAVSKSPGKLTLSPPLCQANQQTMSFYIANMCRQALEFLITS